MLAAEFNKTAMMQVLIDQGAKLNLQDDFGKLKHRPFVRSYLPFYIVR